MNMKEKATNDLNKSFAYKLYKEQFEFLKEQKMLSVDYFLNLYEKTGDLFYKEVIYDLLVYTREDVRDNYIKLVKNSEKKEVTNER